MNPLTSTPNSTFKATRYLWKFSFQRSLPYVSWDQKKDLSNFEHRMQSCFTNHSCLCFLLEKSFTSAIAFFTWESEPPIPNGFMYGILRERLSWRCCPSCVCKSTDRIEDAISGKPTDRHYQGILGCTPTNEPLWEIPKKTPCPI